MTDKMVLYINPKNAKSVIPCIDQVSRKVGECIAKAVQQYSRYAVDPFSKEDDENLLWGVASNKHFEAGTTTMGVHECICGEKSASFDVLLSDGLFTNTLGEHYLVWHRAEVPRADIVKIETMLSKQK